MKIQWIGDMTELQTGVNILADVIEAHGEGEVSLRVERWANTMQVRFDGTSGTIYYGEKVQFFRLLGLFLEHFAGSPFEITEHPQVKTCGLMIDCSRAAVPTVETVRVFLRHMALMGMNYLMLYTEDTYEMEDFPYFGYGRGRYSAQELRECDDFADAFGIEMVPCIQTLAHLSQILKWSPFASVRATDGTLLVGEETTYELISKMFDAASAPFRTKRIHLGLDEAGDLNLGAYLRRNGYRDGHTVMKEHLRRVAEIAREKGLQPIMWSDMFFREGYHGTTEITDEVAALCPPEMQIVYWDYSCENEAEYGRVIRNHQRICDRMMFAGGLQTWHTVVPNYGKLFRTGDAALRACKANGVQEVIATIWGDGGSETNAVLALLGLQLYAEHAYAEDPSREQIFRRFEFCSGEKAQDFYDFEKFDQLPITKPEWGGEDAPSNPSKFLLFQDILLGLCDKNIEGIENLGAYYADLRDCFAQKHSDTPLSQKIYEYGYCLADALFLKADRGLCLKASYEKKDRAGLQAELETLHALREKIDALHTAHKNLWFATNKPFGYEVIDMQYGSLTARVETAIQRLSEYLDGRISRIEELEGERLPFAGIRFGGPALGRFGSARAVASPFFSY